MNRRAGSKIAPASTEPAPAPGELTKPTAPAGKATISRNALKTGVYAQKGLAARAGRAGARA